MAANHGQSTDPLQPEDRSDKWTPSQTHRLDKWAPCQMDQIQPEIRRDTWMRSGADALHNPQALNPQPLPPGFQDETTVQIPRDFPSGPSASRPMWGVGRALGVVLILVLVVVLLGGTLILTHQGGSQPVLLSSPGVYAWEESAALGQASAGLATPCKGTLAPGFDQRLIGGGYTLSRSQAPVTARPALDASSARNVTESWDTSFIPGAGGAQLTNYAICLREPASFLRSPIQYESSDMTTLTSPGPRAIKAACPAGTSVLGGGYVIQPVQQGETQPTTIDSSFPYADGSGAGWEIVPNSINGLDRAQAWAVCSSALHTHVESASVPTIGVFQSAITCAQGTLLGGGFDLLQTRGDNSFSTDYARQDSPGSTLRQDAVQGDTFADWRVIGEINGVGSHYTATLWAVCWDQNGSPPVAATVGPTQAPTVGATAGVMSTPAAAPTASIVPQPTKTPVPSCALVYSGAVTLSSPPPKYVDLNTGNVSSNTFTGAELEWWSKPVTTPQLVFSPVNSSSLAGPLPTPYASVTCAQLEGLTYNQPTVPDKDGEVFAVKLADGQFAKVQVHIPPSGAQSIDITTYKP